MKLPTVNWRISKKIMPMLAPLIFGVETAEKMGYYSLNTTGHDETSAPEDPQQNEIQAREDEEAAALTDKTLIAWYKENRVRYCRK